MTSGHIIKHTTIEAPSLLSSPLSWLLGELVSGWRNVLWAAVVVVAWDQLWGSAIPPYTPATLLCPGREVGSGNAETRRGGILLEDLPEKCHAGSDKERNLDRKREREREKERK